MRRPLLLTTLLLCIGCSGDPEDPDAGTVDAAADAGFAPDARPFACRSLTCNAAEEFCQLTPVGACVGVDGGVCGAGEEPCVDDGVANGCTPERTASCESLGSCENCVCFTQNPPCGVNPTCLSSAGAITIECPYP